MKVNRAYKLNKEKQPAEENGKFLYYFYNNHKLDCIAVDEEQWEKLVELDTEMYNGNRRHKGHSVKLTDNVKPAVGADNGFLHSKKFDSEDDFLRKKDIENLLLKEFSELDSDIYALYEDKFTQKEIAKMVGLSQSEVSKRLTEMFSAIETDDLKGQTQDDDEIYAIKQWRKFKNKGVTDGDEDILWDVFRVEMPLQLQEYICSWFYSYKEYCYFAIKYLVMRAWEKYNELELGNRLNELPRQVREWFYEYYEYEPPCFQWLFIAFFERIEEMKKQNQPRPTDVNFQKLLDKYNEIVKRLECTAEEFYKERIAKPYVEKRNKRYQKYLDENYVLVVDENDTRPIKEQLTAFMEHCKKLDKKYKNKVVTKKLKITE